MPNTFLLTRWYLDCVADNGDSVILYAADLRSNKLSFRYGSLLTVFDGRVGSVTSLHGVPLPTPNGQQISVHLPGLDIEGLWEGLRPSVSRTVFRNPQGTVQWNCIQPMAQVDLQFRRKTRVVGLGYAEYLTVSVVPWELRLTELTWGRYLSQEDSIVWIDWQGGEQLRSVIHNGEEYGASSISDSEIVFAGGEKRLLLDRGLVLRQGLLSDTLFPGISHLAAVMPIGMMSLQQCQWRSRGRFRNGTTETSGWSIHEAVKQG